MYESKTRVSTPNKWDLLKLYLFSITIFCLDTSVYDKFSSAKLEADWKGGKVTYEEIIIAPANSSGKYWKIMEIEKMEQKGIITGIITTILY